jgi:choice-of-anchor A domain-containing protein
VAVGGSANFSNFSVADSSLSPTSSTAADLVVGGGLSWTNGSLFHGSGFVGGATAITSVGLPGGGTISPFVSPLPINFAAQQASLLATSAAQYSALDPTVTRSYSTLTFGSSSDTGLHVYNVSATDLAAANTFNVEGVSTATVIINVLGSVASFQNGGVSLVGGITSAHVLWNFLNATTLTISGIGVNGTVLAPKAAVTFNNGQINGSLIAATLSGSGETHIDQGGNGGADTRFSGAGRSPVSPTPEPSTLASLGTGLLFGLGVMAWRRRRVARA